MNFREISELHAKPPCCNVSKFLTCLQGPSSSPVRRPSNNSTNSVTKGTPSRKTPSPALKGVDPKLAQIILDEILEGGASVQWEDIAGQEVQLIRLTNTLFLCVIHKDTQFLLHMNLTAPPSLYLSLSLPPPPFLLLQNYSLQRI